jgi:hypothetical protein
MFEREIKVTKCGSLQECELNDRISIEFSPYELTNLVYLFRTQVKGTRDYSYQDTERFLLKATRREVKDERILLEAVETAREIWEKARREKDK